jgi:hypothetical protein
MNPIALELQLEFLLNEAVAAGATDYGWPEAIRRARAALQRTRDHESPPL